ncbi:MAG TPA: methionyl-tRNA formyltransferase [Acidimicrobiia bacterium]|nr:methionyl-tRNA formyltransferase [Acidimicrobiia bacterium]
MARVVFLGTPEEAVPTLTALHQTQEIGLVVTQPDRPKGRSRRPVPPPVKNAALELGLTVAQPESRAELAEGIAEHGPFDVGVVVAYGRILRPEVLEQPAHGFVNVHFSLLPRWRGAAPVARALMAGDPMTGVSIIVLEEGLDTGPVLTAQAIDILPDDNAGTLTDRLATVGARLLAEVLPDYLTGELRPVPQTDAGATYAEKIEPEDRVIDPSADVDTVVAQVRGLAPVPGATLVIDGTPHKILAVRPASHEMAAGSWVAVGDRPIVGLGDGAIEVVTIQPPGRNPMSGEDWLRGLHRKGGNVS